CTKAFQASCRRSPPQPGKASQATGTQRLLVRCWADPAGGTETAGTSGAGTDPTRGPTAQATRLPTIPAATAHRSTDPFNPSIPFAMTLLLLEALGALLIFLFIVWWTMFSGRRKGELPEDPKPQPPQAPPQQDPPTR